MRKVILQIAVIVILVASVSAVGLAVDDNVQQSNITNTEETNNTTTSVESNDEVIRENIVCTDMNTENPKTTPFGDLINTVLYLIITFGALVSVLFGTGFTLMSAIKPSNNDYVTRRNKAVVLGGGTIIVVYGVNAMLSEVHSSLDFSCALPFLEGF